MKPALYSALILAASILPASCSRSSAIIVGSKNFTEQIILGEIAAQQIENTLHVPVERRLDLGGTLLAHLALTHGQIDLYPEYTGTALTTVLKRPLATGERQVFETVSALYQQRFHLHWMEPVGFEDSFAMAVRAEDAAKLSAPTLTAASARIWRLGMGYEFLTRPDGLSRLDSVYDLHWEGLPKTMDLGLLYRALNSRQIDMAAANTTDGLLTSQHYQVLRDDKHAFPPYQACFIVRDDTLGRTTGLQQTLAALSGSIDEAAMRHMNELVDLRHIPVVRVAADFLQHRSVALKSEKAEPPL